MGKKSAGVVRAGRARRLVPMKDTKVPARPHLHSPSTRMAPHLHLAPLDCWYEYVLIAAWTCL